MTTIDVFRRITANLDQADIAYMLTGSFASAHYGSPRSTQDIDIVIAATAAQLQTFIQNLDSNEYYAELDAALEAQRRESLFNVIDLISGWKIDLIFRKSRPFSQEEFGRRQRVSFQGLQLFIASVEDVIISKLEWALLSGSQRQIEDAAAVLRVKRETFDAQYTEKWVSALGLEEQWSAAKIGGGLS